MSERRPNESATTRAQTVRRLDFLIRSLTTSVLALMIVGVACAETIRDGDVKGWAGVAAGAVIGWYFGNHGALNSHNLPRTARAADIAPGDER
jgi:hypothetical protein